MLLPIHNYIREKLDTFLATKKIPHILFYGESGSGKQTLVDGFLQKIYNNQMHYIKTNVKHVNCAHGKGIKFIRDDLKFFAKTNIHLNGGFMFKTVVLMNADNLTVDAQSALRRCIEIHSENTRFFIIVQNKHRLLQPILSRFCDIYVPYPIINGEQVNLHQWKIQESFPFLPEQERKKQDTIQSLYHFYSKDEGTDQFSHDHMVDLVSDLYEHAISSYDVMEWIRHSSNWTRFEKANGLVCFAKVKSEFRCEKLLMFYLFDFMHNRSTIDLTTLSFL